MPGAKALPFYQIRVSDVSIPLRYGLKLLADRKRGRLVVKPENGVKHTKKPVAREKKCVSRMTKCETRK